jgi:hypothetical protein
MVKLKVFRFIISPTITEYFVIGQKNKRYIDHKGSNLKIKNITKAKAASVKREYSTFPTEKFIELLNNRLQPSLF